MTPQEQIQRVLSGEDRYCVITADCLQVLPTLPSGSVDAVVMDPPYGVGVEYASFDDSRENLAALVSAVMPEVLRVARVVAVTPGNGNQPLYPPPSWTLCWFNNAGAFQSPWGFTCWQPVLVYGKCPYRAANRGARPDGWIGNHAANVSGHPCPKPIEFMRWLVERVTLEDATVLDPFCGSGTTGVACIQTGRNFIGIEIDEKYAAIARRRCEDAAPLFVPPTPAPDPALFG